MMRYKKLIITLVLISLLSVIDTIKGAVIMEYGYSYQFCFIELVSLLTGIILLLYVYKNISNSKCTTIIKKSSDDVSN
jgi:hypothetical protein